MVQNFGRVVVAVAALNAAVTLAQSQTNSYDLEAREEVPYTRRHFTRDEMAELEAREFSDDFAELEAREPEPDPLHVPFFSNWNAGRKQRNADRQKGKQERVQAEKAGESSSGSERRELAESELEAREFDMEDLEAREFDMEELEAREPEPEPEPIHVPFFSNWNAGRKQRNADRQKGKQERVQAEKAGESSSGSERRELAESELETREFDMEELEAREPEPEPLHVPFFSDWNAGRKQRNADRQRGKQDRLKAEKAGESSAGAERREFDDMNEFDARSLEFELDELD